MGEKWPAIIVQNYRGVTVDATLISEGFDLRLRSVLAEMHLSQTELARRTGVTSQYVSAMCGGKVQPGADFLAGLRSSLGVSLDWLLLAEGPMMTGQAGMLFGGGVQGERQAVDHLVEMAIARSGLDVVEGVLNALARPDADRRSRQG